MENTESTEQGFRLAPEVEERFRSVIREELDAARRREAAPAPLLTEQDVADVLDVSTRTVQTLRASGEIQALRVRSAVRYTPEAVESYVRRQAKVGAREGSGR